MKKKQLFSAFLAILLMLNLGMTTVRAETDPTGTEPEESWDFSTLPWETGPQFAPGGDASVNSGPHSINGQVPMIGLMELPVKAKAAMLYEVNTQTVMYSYNVDQKLYPASLTKVMTCLLAVELCQDYDEVITVSEALIARVDPSGSGMDLVAGEQLTMDQLLYGLMVESANDAAMVIAEHLCGSEEAFVRKMNQRAHGLGCDMTNFMNVHGLHHEEHYTTARDMTRILAEAIKNEDFLRYFTTAYIVLPATNKSPEREIITTNYMMSKEVTEQYYDTRVLGGKTGTTTPAGRCLVTLSEAGGMRMISVILGGELVTAENDPYTVISYGNFEETKRMIDLGYRNFMATQVLSPNQTLGQFDVAYGSSATQGVVKGTVDTVVPKESDLSAVRYEYILDEGALVAPLEAGSPIGVVQVWYQTKCLAQQELYAASWVEKDIPTTSESKGTDPADPVDGSPSVWHIVLIVILAVLGLFAAMLLAAWIRAAMIRAKRARRRKNQRKGR